LTALAAQSIGLKLDIIQILRKSLWVG